MKSAIVFGAIIVGLLCLVTSSMWNNLFPATSHWTNEKAQRSAEVKARLAYLGGYVNATTPRSMHGGPDPATAKTEFDALTKENEQLNAEFESVASKPHTIAKVLKWTGIILAVVGIIGWYAVKES